MAPYVPLGLLRFARNDGATRTQPLWATGDESSVHQDTLSQTSALANKLFGSYTFPWLRRSPSGRTSVSRRPKARNDDLGSTQLQFALGRVRAAPVR
jgi:hypothetical protein